MASVLGEVHASSIAAVKFCSQAITNREITSRSSLSNRVQLLATLAIDIQEEYLRALRLRSNEVSSGQLRRRLILSKSA